MNSDLMNGDRTSVEIEKKKVWNDQRSSNDFDSRYESIDPNIMKRMSTNRERYYEKVKEWRGTRYRLIVHRSKIDGDSRSGLIRVIETMLDNSRGLLIDAVTSATVCNPKCCRGHAVATCARRWQDHQLGELIAQQKYAGDGNRRVIEAAFSGQNVTSLITIAEEGGGWGVMVMIKTCEKKMRWGKRVNRELSL